MHERPASVKAVGRPKVATRAPCRPAGGTPGLLYSRFMETDQTPGLYALIDRWIGLGLEHQPPTKLLGLSEQTWNDLLISYVQARDYDDVSSRTLGTPVADRPGQLHVHIPRRERGDWAEPDWTSMRRSLLYSHGVVLNSHLMHYLAIGNYGLATRELALMAKLRKLVDVGAVRWREAPALACDYRKTSEGQVERHNGSSDDFWRLMIQPGLWEPGLDYSDIDRLPDNFLVKMSGFLRELRHLAPLGMTTVGSRKKTDGDLLTIWLKHVETCAWADDERMCREVAELLRLVARFPHIAHGTLPAGRPEILTLFKLPVDDLQVSLNDIQTIRQNSDRFLDWRLGLHQALGAVGEETLELTDPDQWESAAMTVMHDHLAPKAAALRSEAHRASPTAGMTSIVASTLAMTGATAAVGGSALEAGAGGVVGAVGGLAAAALRWRRGNREFKSELAHFLTFAK